MLRRILLLTIVLAPNHTLAQSVAPIYEGRLKGDASIESSPTGAGAGAASVEVSKTAYIDGQKVCGEIRIKNSGQSPVSVTGVVDFLEVHFPKMVTPPPALLPGSTREWFRVADVPIPMPGVPLPGPIAPRATATIDYCFSLCLAADAPGANSMRNVVTVTVTSQSGIVKTVTTRSTSFPPPVLDCQACCLPDGSCSDTVPDECAAAGGLSKGIGSDCATTECTQACCRDGTCSNETLIACQDGGEPLGLGTACATVTATCLGACCFQSGCVDGVSLEECSTQFGLGSYLGNDTTCAAVATTTCPTGACCSDGSCVDKINQQLCEQEGAGYFGDGTTCTSTSCTEACCFGDRPCENLLPSECAAQGGDHRGPGTECSDLLVCSDFLP